jgi:hypothetical protein
VIQRGGEGRSPWRTAQRQRQHLLPSWSMHGGSGILTGVATGGGVSAGVAKAQAPTTMATPLTERRRWRGRKEALVHPTLQRPL